MGRADVIRLLSILMLMRNGGRHETETAKSSCVPLYGIRIHSGRIEKVLDAARCSSVDADRLSQFLVNLKPQLGNRTLDLEITDSSVATLKRSSLAGLPIRRMRLQRSRLQAVDADCFDGLENVLEELDLSENQLDAIPVAIRNLAVLWHLDLSRNRIRSLPEGTVFFHLLKLRHLNLNHNRLITDHCITVSHHSQRIT